MEPYLAICCDIDKTIVSLRKSLRGIQDKLDRAEADRLCLALKKQVNQLRFSLAESLLDSDNIEDAYIIYDSLSWRAKNEMAFYGMSRTLIELNRFDRALVMLEKGLAKYPESAFLWQNLGNLYHTRRDHAQALKCFEKAFQFLPGHPAILMSQGNALYGMGSYEEARAIFQKLSAEYPQDPHYIIMLGYCNLNTGYPEAAAGYFKQIINTVHETPDTYHGMYWAYYDMGLESDALDLIQKSIRKYPSEDSQLYIDMGYSYFCKGWVDEARDILIKGLEIFPEDEDIKDLLRQIDEEKDDSDMDPKSPGQGIILLMLLYKKGRLYRNE